MQRKQSTPMYKADKAFSDFIRARDNWTCQRCKTKKDPTDPYQRMGLHCSHYFRRGNKSTRYDEDNCVALCYGCHQKWEGDKQGEYRDFMVDRLGEDVLKELQYRTNQMCKMSKSDYEDVRDYYLEELKRVEHNLVKCPYCRREFKGDRGVATHLERGDCE